MQGFGEGSDGAPRACVWLFGDTQIGVRVIAARLVEAGFEVFLVGARGAVLFDRGRPPPQLVVAQHRPPRLDAIELVGQVRETCQVPVIVVSAEASVSTCEEAMRKGASRFLVEEDADRVGEIGQALLRAGSSEPVGNRPRRWTAAEARRLRAQELFERLDRLLYETRGNIAEMARRMGRDRSTVRYHLARFGMLDRIGRCRSDRTRQRQPGPPVDRSETG